MIAHLKTAHSKLIFPIFIPPERCYISLDDKFFGELSGIGVDAYLLNKSTRATLRIVGHSHLASSSGCHRLSGIRGGGTTTVCRSIGNNEGGRTRIPKIENAPDGAFLLGYQAEVVNRVCKCHYRDRFTHGPLCPYTISPRGEHKSDQKQGPKMVYCSFHIYDKNRPLWGCSIERTPQREDINLLYRLTLPYLLSEE